MPRPKLTALADLMPPKGGATRPEPIVALVIKQDSELSSKQAGEQAAAQLGVDEQRPELDQPSEYQDGPRSAVSFRMTERLQERLPEDPPQTRGKKQELLDHA